MQKIVPLLLIMTFILYSNAHAESDETLDTQPQAQTAAKADNPQNEVTTLEPYVVEATRSETNYKKLPASVDVITSEDLEIKSSTDNLYDAVKNAPGVHTDTGSGMGWSSMLIRGESPSVLFNGLSVTPLITSNSINVMTAGSDSIERIEILKGSLAATQGSGATSGVINLVPKRGSADNPYIKVKLKGGDNDTQDGSFTVSGGKGDFAWFASYAQKSSGNFDSPKGRIDYTDSRYRNFYGNLDFSISKEHMVSLEVLYNDGRYRTGGEGYYDEDVTTAANRKIWENKPTTTGIFAKYNGEFDRFDIKATVGYLKDHLDVVYGNGSYDVPSFLNKDNTIEYEETSYIGDVKSNIDILEDDLLSAHLDYLHVTADVNAAAVGGMPFDFDAKSHQNSFTGQLESKPISYVLLIAGVRYDNYKREGSTTDHTGANFGVSVYPFAETDYNWTTLWASYSEAFKTPPFAYLYGAVPNPSLKNEESEGWEIGIKQDLSHWASFSISYFDTDYTDRIVFDLTTFRMENIGKTETTGFETQLEIYPMDHLTLYANYLDMERIDKTTDSRTYSSPTPDSKLVIGAALKDYHNFTVSLEGAHYIDFKLSNGEEHPSEGKTVLDTKLSYEYRYDNSLTLTPYISIANLTDEQAYSSGGAVAIRPGRTILCGIGAQYDF